METKLITKTIKELADEYDGNVEQLHRTISICNESITDLKRKNEMLEYRIEHEQLKSLAAEEKLKKSIVAMFVLAALCSLILLLKF